MEVNPYEVLFQQSDNDLVMTRMGASGSVRIRNWFVGAEHQIESIWTGASENEYTWHQGELSPSGVQQLVQAMASFTPDSGQTAVSQLANPTLHAVIQSAWAVQTVHYDIA